MFDPTVEVVLGPPGTGKTTVLLDAVDKELANGTPPDRIAFTTFTRRGAYEAAERARNRFKLKEHDLPYFRTLHSLAYRLLGLSKPDVIQSRHYKEMEEILNLRITGYVNTEEGLDAQAELGDKLLQLHQLAQARDETVEETWQQFGEGTQLMEVERFSRTYEELKSFRGIWDFSDMISKVQGAELDIDVAFVDEAQDLSLAQWCMVYPLLKRARRVVLAGDDDQAIYRWAGASVSTFLQHGRAYSTTVLGQSYRLPQKVWQLAVALSNDIHDRLPKTWKPRDVEGAVHRMTYLDDIPVDEGEWLILARNRVFLKDVVAHLREKGIAFTAAFGDSIRSAHKNAIEAHVKLQQGKSINTTSAKSLLTAISGRDPAMTGKGLHDKAGLGVDTQRPWFDVLTSISPADRVYYRAVLRRYGKLRDLPGPKLGTIHSSKGGEADNVLLLTAQTAATWENSQRVPDDEARVWYVGATRAKEALWILPSESAYNKVL